jgi:tRNA (cmo5U34)-methyltransferase
MAHQQPDHGRGMAPAPGQPWKNEELVNAFVEQTSAQSAERKVLFDFACDLFPFEANATMRVLDIGAGYGAFAATVLERFPNATVVGLDFSEPMMAVGRERMARFGQRFAYHVGDIARGELPADLRVPFDPAVASASIVHLPTELKQRMYGGVLRVLRPGGCFFNVDRVSPPNAEMRDWYRVWAERERQHSSSQLHAPNQHGRMLHHQFDTEAARHHHFETEADMLALLHAAGFVQVDCFYKRLLQTVIGGFKPT